ncbi:MAG: SusE outer membrane protein, partial [Pedobacter sp.]|nr:SusE outer membrane protein [Pedobacter sp.]
MDGDFSKPLFSYPSEGNGLYNRLSLSHTELNKIASIAGIESLAAGKIKWTVRSSKGVNVQQSAEIRTLELERPAGFSEIPADLYLTGAASEGGDDLTKAIQFKKTATGVFEVYTEIKPGAYHFAERNAGTPKTFSVEGDNLKNGGSVDYTGAKKVYRIQVDFNTASVSYTEIVSIGLFFSADNKVIFNLPYTSNGLFVAPNQPVVFHQESWGRDERYKFQVNVKKADGAAAVEWMGSTNRDNQAATADTPPSYFNVVPVDNSQYDFSFKFNHAADNHNVDLVLKLNAESSYTHTVTVK